MNMALNISFAVGLVLKLRGVGKKEMA